MSQNGILRSQLRRYATASVMSLFFLPFAAQAQPSSGSGPKFNRASDAEIKKHIDRAWVTKAFLHDMMDHWLAASVMPSGFIQENLDRQWKPWGTQREASLNGQGRMLYTFVEAYKINHDKRYLDAMTKCADFLMKMHDDQYGGYFNRVSPDFKIIDDTKTGFTSFAIFPLAHAAMATNDAKYARAAMQAWTEVRDKMRDGQFFQNSMKRDFSGPAPMNMGAAGRGGPSTAAAPPGQAEVVLRPAAMVSTSTCLKLYWLSTRPLTPRRFGTKLRRKCRKWRNCTTMIWGTCRKVSTTTGKRPSRPALMSAICLSGHRFSAAPSNWGPIRSSFLSAAAPSTSRLKWVTTIKTAPPG